eukprot:g1928.t1
MGDSPDESKTLTSVEEKSENSTQPDFGFDLEPDSDEGVPQLEEEEIPKWRAIMPVSTNNDFTKLLRKARKKKKKKKKKDIKVEKVIVRRDLPSISPLQAGCTSENILACGTTTFDYSGAKHHAPEEIIGRQPPNFSGFDLDGKLRNLTDWTTNGRPTVLCFYVPWSGPCQLQVPLVEKQAHKYPVPVIPPGGVDFVICSCDHIGAFDKNPVDLIKEFHTNYNLTAPNLTNMTISKDSLHKIHQYGVQYFPHLCLINKDGVVLANFSDFNWDLVTKAEIFANITREKRFMNMKEFHLAWQMMGYAAMTDWYLKVKWKEIMLQKWENQAKQAAEKAIIVAEQEAELERHQVENENSSMSEQKRQKIVRKSIKKRLRNTLNKLATVGWLRRQIEAKEKETSTSTSSEDDDTDRKEARKEETNWIELDSEGWLDGLDISQMLNLPMPETKLPKKFRVDSNTDTYLKEVDRHREYW